MISRKGEGLGKKSGGAASGGSGSGEDSSWGKEASKLCKEIKKDLREAGPKDATEAVAGGSGVQRPVEEGVTDERAEDTSSSDDEDEANEPDRVDLINHSSRRRTIDSEMFSR